MGDTGERIGRRCWSEFRPVAVPEPIRCTKGQGHSGPHTGTHTIVLNYEWGGAIQSRRHDGSVGGGGVSALEEPRLYPVSLYVCALCLNGAGGECHAPGCAFWMHDAPMGDSLRVLREYAIGLPDEGRTP